MPKIRVGTSGWSYPHWMDGVFYPKNIEKGKELEYYAGQFDTVEINSTFYHLPKEQTFRNWVMRTPKDFIFSVKGSRFISHILKLDNASDPLERMLARLSLLKEKLGPILFQFPPTWEIDEQRLSKFLKILPKKAMVALEFRHPSWFVERIYKILEEANVALTVSDTPAYPLVKKATASFAYIRLHGHEKLYASAYSDAELASWARSAARWLSLKKGVFIYFDNDAAGHAPKNASKIKEILKI